MGKSKLAISVGKVVTTSAKGLGTFQTGVNKILWGSANTQPEQTVKYNTTTGTLNYTSTPTTPTKPAGSLVESGLFNVLDVLNSVDLCNVLSYFADTISIKKNPRPDKSTWTAAQTALYTLQDQAASVQTQIDKFMAFPNVFIGSYIGTGPNAVPINQAVSQSGAPKEGGTGVTAYNVYFLMQSIKDTFSFNTPGTGSLFTAEDKTLLTGVPGLGGNLNIIDDFLGTINKYSDYRQIPNAELQNLINKINIVRSVCVTIQNLDFKSALSLVGNFLGTDIRSQIQKLSQFLDPTKIIPTLKQINSSLQAFIRIGNQIQGILRTGQFLIKLALLFYKVFKFIIKFFSALPAPLAWSTAGIQTTIQDAKEKAKDESDGVMILLKSINSLLSVVVMFIRYLLTNTNELIRRLDILLLNLQACQAVKDSDVLRQLESTKQDLLNLREQLATYITQYDSKTNPDTAMFGGYDIRVVDEQLTDQSIVNKRRRGIALDTSGQIVAQSDLTFATNTAVIIAEVQQKLISEKLVQPSLGVVDGTNLATISDSLNYLESNDVLNDNLNIEPTQLDSPDNLDENQGLGINAFFNNLPGGKKLRQRTRKAVQDSVTNVKAEVSGELASSKQTLGIN
jgi:hypothetical protein